MKIKKYEFLCHMTNMAAAPIYGKIVWKTFFSGNIGLIALKLGM